MHIARQIFGPLIPRYSRGISVRAVPTRVAVSAERVGFMLCHFSITFFSSPRERSREEKNLEALVAEILEAASK
jgi:hypothetical protein